jgi:hypothetical protein
VKRYRVVNFDLDSRALILQQNVDPNSDSLAHRNRNAILSSLVAEFGQVAHETKVKNFTELGPKPFSILAFHNQFASQIRNAFVIGSFYPALVGACALGERILNHLLRLLRDDFSHTKEYKKVLRKNSFDDWGRAIQTLLSWDVLLPDVADHFRDLATVRNRAIHFSPDTDTNDRVLSLKAIGLLDRIIGGQFPVIGLQPWFIPGAEGESYISRDWESRPFVRAVYLPNCMHLGPAHEVVSVVPEFVVRDRNDYPEVEVSDAEFLEIRKKSVQILVGTKNS